MADRRKRISLYFGPRDRVQREDLPDYEATHVAEIKSDGEWCLVTFTDGVIVGLDSRTGLPLTSDGLLGLRCALSGSGQLAGELVADAVGDERTGTRRLHLFEIYDWNGIDFRDTVLETRREALVAIYRTLQPKESGRILLTERRESGFLAWYDDIMSGKSKVIGKRAEGLVLKKRGTTLRGATSDGKTDVWLRCKPLNTIDYVVIGADGFAAKGTPKIALGLYKQTKDGRRVVKCMSPTWPDKFEDGSSATGLKSGDVVEVVGAEVFPSGAIRHGHIKRARPDKLAIHCTYEAAIAA